MRSILHGDLRIDIIGGAGGRVARLHRRQPVETLLRPRSRPQRATAVPPGRQQLIAEAVDQLRNGVPVEFHAPCGFGKSTLLRHLAAHAGERLGVPGVYLPVAVTDDPDDVLQLLVRRLYRFDRPAKLTADECAAQLRRTRAVIALDDVPFTPHQVARLLGLLYGCRILVGGTHPVIGRHGWSRALPGLSDEDAAGLIGEALGRPLDDGERTALPRLAAAVQGQPLRFRQAAALVASGEYGLAELADRAYRDPVELDRLSLGALAGPERRLLATLALTAGALLPRDLLGVIGDIGRVDDALGRLRRSSLVDHRGDRFGLPVCQADSYRALLHDHLNLAGAVRDIADYLTALDPGGKQALSAVNAALSLIEYAAERNDWPAVARLARAAEPVLTLAGRWHAARRVLDLGLQAAQAIENLGAEAFFAHQQGTLALCRDDWRTAHDHLTHALRLRERLGDHAGVQITNHNLALTVESFQPPGDPTPDRVEYTRPIPDGPDHPWWLFRGRRAAAYIGLVVAIVVAVLGMFSVAGPGEGPDPPPSAAPSTTAPSPGPSGSPSPSPPVVTDPPPQPPPRPPSPPNILPPVLDDDGAFGLVHLGDSSPPREFTVTNPNPRTTIVLSSPMIIGTDVGAFGVTSKTCGAALGPRQTCTLVVTFTPTHIGNHTATLVVSDRDGREASKALSGTAYVRLRINIEGKGTVRLSDRPLEQACTAAFCSKWVVEPRITLEAMETNSNYDFLRWGDACVAAGAKNTCGLLSKDTTVTATFSWIVE